MRCIYQILYIFCFTLLVLYVHADEEDKKSKEKKEKKDIIEEKLDNENSTDSMLTKHEELMQKLNNLKKVPPMRFITYAPYTFEGVDYDELPAKLLEKYNDCYGQFTICIRSRAYFQEMCSYSIHKGYVPFRLRCEMDLQNCIHRVKRGHGVFGTDYTNNEYYFNGEGWDCSYYLRNGKNPEDNMNDKLDTDMNKNVESSIDYIAIRDDNEVNDQT